MENEGKSVISDEIDLGEEPIEESSSKSHANINGEEPKLGMEFSSDESAYQFYKDYGGKTGFDVRKNHVKKNKKGFVTRRTFSCSKEGHRKDDKRRENALYRQPVSRVGCEAHMICQLHKNGKYKVVAFNPEHNHELIRTPMKHMLKINRSISGAQKAHADDAEKSGIPIKATIDFMSTELGGRENLGFLDVDYRNYIHRKRRMAMEKGDAGAILRYFQNMQLENSSYFYSIQLDEDDMITNIFWADARSVSDYGLFGDVLCFDTTYRTNEYGRPFAPFIGVNHHKQTVIFGAALLYDETAESFKWLFETFLDAMSKRQPKTILTDRSAAMAKAISEVFPQSYHRLCVWHIYQNAAKNLSKVFHGSNQFAHDFSECVYDYEEEAEWMLAWNNMLEKYNLKENAWLQDLFKQREKWALVYGRHTFTADMKSTQRSESMNNVLKKYLMPSHDLLRFFEHYERLLADRRYEELKADFHMVQTRPVLATDVEMLRQAVEIYTPEVFTLFQKEYMDMLDCIVYKVDKSGTTSKYKVCYMRNSKEHLVTFEVSTNNVVCSCMKFSFIGILCAHAIKVLDKKNIKRIPPQYVMNRWTQDAKCRNIVDYKSMENFENPKESMGKRYGHLCRSFREVASFAAEHEILSAHAHGCLVQLLKELHDMKKKLCLENVIHNSNGETSIGGNEQVEQVAHFVNSMTTNVRGVKRKATVGRPRKRLKDPLEQRRRRTQKSAKTPAKKSNKSLSTSVQDFSTTGCYSQESHGTGHGPQNSTILTQDFSTTGCYSQEPHATGHGPQNSTILTQDFRTTSCYSQEPHATGHGSQNSTILTQHESHIPFSTQVATTSGQSNFDVNHAATDWHNNMSYTQPSMAHCNHLPQSPGGKESGS